jgi:hypothetical protein
LYLLSVLKTKKKTKNFTFNVDGQKKSVNSGTYYKAEIKFGNTLKINSGNSEQKGSTFRWEPDKPAEFITLSEFEVGGTTSRFGIGVQGVYIPVAKFNSKQLQHIDRHLGFFLIQILKQSE